MLQPVDRFELAADVELLGSVEEVADRGVFVVASEDFLGLDGPVVPRSIFCVPCGHAMTRRLAVWLGLLVGPVHVLDGEDGQVAVVTEIA